MRLEFVTRAVILLTSVSCLLNSWAEGLPNFEDFRRVDRIRRLTGQMTTAELMRVMQIDAGLIARTVQQHADDPKLAWGAAELLVDWPRRRTLYESAIQATGTNVAIATRLACAAAQQRDYDTATTWLQYCQKKDSDNTVPWLAELWLQRQQKQPVTVTNAPPIWTTNFRDYSVDASRARIRLLEAAGYSPYAARRLGFSPDSVALTMVRDLSKPPIDEVTGTLLKEAAHALQRQPQFLLNEFVGQTAERAMLALRKDADTSAEVRLRSVEIEQRRTELKNLLADVDRNTVDFANEAEMVKYFDDVLNLREEPAMKRLAATVRRQPNAP